MTLAEFAHRHAEHAHREKQQRNGPGAGPLSLATVKETRERGRVLRERLRTANRDIAEANRQSAANRSTGNYLGM